MAGRAKPVTYEIITRPAQGSTPHLTPILFVHGAWHGAWCWEAYFMPYFAERGFGVTAFSLRGHGKSSGRRTVQRARLRDYLDDLQAIIARFETPPALVGHSMGGLLIQHLLQTRHDIPAAALLAPIPHFGTVGIAWRTVTRRPHTALHVMTRWDVYPLVAEPQPDGTRFFSPHMPTAEAERYMRRFTRESFLAVGVDALFLDLPRRPARVTTPLLVVGGQYDTLFPPGEIQRTARAYGKEAVIVPDMGHELMLDPGWQHVADRVIAHVAAQPVAGAVNAL